MGDFWFALSMWLLSGIVGFGLCFAIDEANEEHVAPSCVWLTFLGPLLLILSLTLAIEKATTPKPKKENV